jgi:hypothetical protein
MNGDETRKQVEDDANEDLELQDEDAENVAGGLEYLKIKMTDVIITSSTPNEQKI